MSTTVFAVGTCRVSTPEQEANGSLPRQRNNVLKAAARLGVTIPDNYWFSGSVSSKRGTNLKRKDLIGIIKLCKKDKRIKYLIIDELDRFMRSMLELGYFWTVLDQLGVKVIFASQPDLGADTAAATLMLMLEAYRAEGSNEERQHKSINGQTEALRLGRYPFHPKPGYRRGYVKGVAEIDEQRGPALKQVLEQMAAGMITPTQALKELNQSDFVKGRKQYKMDKFRKIATDPFYAGTVEVHKQVNLSNPNGVHEILISPKTHAKILRIFNSKEKNQSGPLKEGNPKYPCNNIVHCDNCKDNPYNRMVGFDLTNGKPSSKVYEKYRCRGCRRSIERDELHGMIAKHMEANSMTTEGRKVLLRALKTVWKQKEGDLQTERARMSQKLVSLKLAIDQQVEAAIDPANISIKDNIMESITKKQQEVTELEYKVSTIQATAAAEEERFMQFALGWVSEMGENFLAPNLSKENRLRCKQIIFPAGFRLDKKLKVYTPEISPLITLATNKKDLPIIEKSSMVRVKRL